MNILIVEDEVRLAEALAQIMTEQKYSVDVVHDGEDGLAYAESGLYDVVVLDVMLPKRSGFEVVRALRGKKIATPVLLLTADYMTKPFSPEELLARVRALARRQGDVVLEEMTFSDVTLNLSAYTLECGAKSVHLGFKEFEVMRLLMGNPSMIVPKDDLITRVWGTESGAEDNNVEAYISFLRKKLFFLGSKVNIGTVRKVGYRLEEDAS